MISVHSCVRGRILLHLPEEWRFAVHSCVGGKIPVHMRDDDFGAFMCEVDIGAFTWGMMISVFPCLRGRISLLWCLFIYLRSDDFCAFCMRGMIPVHLFEGWWFRCIHVWGVGYRCIYLRSDDLRCICVWGVRFRCICLRDDDFGAFMCEG